MPTYGSLFAGIGGMDLGFDRAGWSCKWQVEIDPYCQRVLKKHWPNVEKHEDVRRFAVSGSEAENEAKKVDCIVGGFPCQDISYAGAGAGIDGERSGLWREYIRIVRVLRPRFVVVENVAALLARGVERVLGDLASCGYDAEWSVLSACEMGAPHMRKRLFILAYLREDGRKYETNQDEGREDSQRSKSHAKSRVQEPPGRSSGTMFDVGRWANPIPDLCGTPDGFPDWMDRVSALGNAIVPDCAEFIARRINTKYLNDAEICPQS